MFASREEFDNWKAEHIRYSRVEDPPENTMEKKMKELQNELESYKNPVKEQKTSTDIKCEKIEQMYPAKSGKTLEDVFQSIRVYESDVNKLINSSRPEEVVVNKLVNSIICLGENYRPVHRTDSNKNRGEIYVNIGFWIDDSMQYDEDTEEHLKNFYLEKLLRRTQKKYFLKWNEMRKAESGSYNEGVDSDGNTIGYDNNSFNVFSKMKKLEINWKKANGLMRDAIARECKLDI